MLSCRHCTELIWDHLYGLLDADQAEELRAHLAGCPACQAVLAEAEVQQRLVARAARFYDTVPAFLAPEADRPQQVAAPASQPSSRPTVVTLPRQRHARRRWPWLAAAAALLLFVGGYVWYQQALAEHRQDRDLARAALRDIDSQIDKLEKQTRQTQALVNALPKKILAEQFRLEVEGPADYAAGAPTQYRVATRNGNGTAARATGTARIVASGKDKPGDRRVLAEQDFKTEGEAVVSLASSQAVPPDALLSLEVEAEKGETREVVRHKLDAVRPGYSTHLAIDKAIYRKGEILFFRTLTLDQFSDQPPRQPIELKATLIDGQGTRHLLYRSQTASNGIASGQLALTTDLGDGECTLEVAGAGGLFPPVERRFVLLRQEPDRLDKTLRFDRAAYGPGDEVRANFQARKAQSGAAAANRKVTGNVKVNEQPVPASVTAPPTNAKGESELRFRLPAKMPKGPADLEIHIKDGNQVETLRQAIPMTAPAAPASPSVQVEFFPEGGELVAGVPGRVYFRARTVLGQPVDLQAVLTNQDGKAVKDKQGHDVVVLTKQQQGLGVFEFTPQTGQSYTLRVTSPNSGAIHVPRLTAQKTGVALSVPEGVSTEGQSLLVRVRNTGDRRGLVVAASWRGRVVDEKCVSVADKETEVLLNPPAGVHGILRITVYQPVADNLVPLAERLVYRLPTKRLQLTVQADKARYNPGQQVTLSFRAANEKDEAADAWLLASVVDEQALGLAAPKEQSGQATDFYLTSDVRRPQDLERADLWVRDSPKSFATVDRFLGTQGWRRFEPPAQMPARGTALARRDDSKNDRAAVALLKVDNADELNDHYKKALASATLRLGRQAGGAANSLMAERKQLVQEDRRAEADLVQFQQLPQLWLHVGLSVAVVVLLAIGCLALVIGLVRTVWGAAANTPYFATAFASLLICTVALFVARQGEPADGPTAETKLEQHTALTGLRTPPAEPVPPARDPVAKGLYASLPLENVAPAPLQSLAAKEKELAMLRESRRGTFAMSFNREAKAKDASEKTDMPGPLRKRFENLENNQRRSADRNGHDKKSDKDRNHPADVLATPSRTEDSKTRGGKSGAVPVEYAHLHPRGKDRTAPDLQETLLWYPALRSADGKARVSFDLSDKPTTYHILVQGHTLDGRLGVAQGELTSTPAK
jgi:hypothetical protein